MLVLSGRKDTCRRLDLSVCAILECSCLKSSSSGEILIYPVFQITLTYFIFHLIDKQKQHFPSVIVVFGANIITVHSCVHMWARCLQDYNLSCVHL